MLDYLKRSWAVVDLDNLAHNVAVIRSMLQPGCRIMGVVKADAYGHGDRYIASQLVRQGVEWLGVSNLEEALSLRGQGIALPILIFGFTPPERVDLLNQYTLTQTVYTLDYAIQLQAEAERAKVSVEIHIKVDTGMSRLGFVAEDGTNQTVEDILAACTMSRLRPGGIFTHFASADELDENGTAFTRAQFRRFQEIIDRLEERGLHFPLRHCCNSAGTMIYPEMHLDMVRPGIILYGIDPSEDCGGCMDLQPVMELYSVVAQVKRIPAGAAVSYGRIYTADHEVVVATVPIGYADGYQRQLSNQGRMLVKGQYAPVIGRVCMDQLMLDITHIPGVVSGDLVTLVGADGANQLGFDEMARLTGTIAYEKTCLIGRRVPRVYRRDGRELAAVDYVRSQWDDH